MTQDRELGSVEVTLAVESCEKLKNNDSLIQNPPPEDSRIFDATKTVCDWNGHVPVEMNGQNVTSVNTDDFSDAVLDRFKSMSCDNLKHRNETSLREISRERDRLVICLMCFVAARWVEIVSR